MKKLSAALCALLVLTAAASLSISANSAQTWWEGVNSTGAIVTDGECPIVVENELLTFDVDSFPQSYYHTAEEYLSYTGKVTAQYSFYNPADYTVTARLLFPFGAEPTYAHYDGETDADAIRYSVKVNGEDIPTTLRHSLTDRWRQFELSRDLSLLHDGFMEDDFYYPDMPVTAYLFKVSEVDSQKYPAACAAFDVKATDYPNSRLYLVDQRGAHSQNNDTMRISVHAENDAKLVLYVIGEPLESLPQWKIYKNGGVSSRESIDGTVTYYDTETTTLRQFAAEGRFEDHSAVSETDWYNAKIALLKDSETTSFGSMLYVWHANLNSPTLMRWYEYEITLAPSERIVNTVTAPIYPAIDANLEPSLYTYTYLLSPAKTWADFGELSIVINTPYYLLSNEAREEAVNAANVELVKTDSGYALTLDGLPEGELVFALSSSPQPTRPPAKLTNYIPIEIIISFSVIGAIVLLLVALTVIFIRKKKRAKIK